MLRTCDELKNDRAEIAAFFADHPGRKERGDFIKAFFNNTYVEKILSNGQRAGYRAWDDVLTLWRGAYLSREKEVFMRWDRVADAIYGMILLDQWLAPDERPLPSEAEQISFIEQAEAEKASAFTIPQEAIDYILCGGSGVSEGKYRIFEQFQKNEGKQENIKFLRDEYGIGGRSDAIPGSGYFEDHDGKGITISRNYSDPDGKFLLSWAKVEKRIGELIAADRYLNRAEKEHYPEYQAQVEARKARWKIADEIRSIIDDYVDFKTQLGEKEQCAEVLFARTCTHSFGVGDKKNYVLTMEGSFVLPTLRDAMQTIIGDKTHLTERCEAMLAELNGPLAAPLEPTYEELNPPPPPKKEYRFALGDTVYLGTQEYELLAFDEQTVRLFDPAFPIINKELPRADFDRMLAENPLNDGLLQVVEEAPPAAEAVEPDTPQAVGRIDFLAANGTVGDSVEYTDAEQFVAAIKEENHVGTPMGIILYRDSEGQTIPQDFVAELDPPPQEFEVIDYAQARLDEAIELINEYCWKEFEQEADFSDLHHIDLAFGSTSDNKYVIEASADLIDFRLVYQVDGEVVMSLQCRDLDDLNVHLANLSFDNMIAYAEEQYEKRQEQNLQASQEQAAPNDEVLTELQKKAAEIARKYESLPMQEKIGIIAQVFGCTSGKIETSPCSGKWRGTSDVSIRFDNGTSLCIGNERTPQARTAKVWNEFINATLTRYNPEIVAAAKEAALHALRKQETTDNEIAVQKGLKPYTLLTVEITDGTGDKSGFIGWYYVTLAVDGKIFALLESGLSYEIANGKAGEVPKRNNYFVAGGLKEADVDFVFHNVGHSSTDTIYSLRINDDVRERAEKALSERIAAVEPVKPDTPGYDLGFGHLGNGVTVWNRLELRDGDYKTIAHIAPDRTVTYYENGLPEDVRTQIEEFAATSTMTISATQDAPVFSTPPLVREPAVTPAPQPGPDSGRFWDAYNSIKERNPDSLLLYQVGDFFELYGGAEGADAWNAATALNLTLTKRNIPEYGRVSMCGFPAHKLKDFVKKLNSKGFDVIVAALKNKQRVISAFPAQPSEKAKQETDDFSDIDPSAIRAALAENGIVDGHVVDPEKLDATPFIQQVMADVEQIAADTPQAPERFSVIETEGGYAIWDDIQGGIYVDGEGVQEEFTSEWQAEDYLKQVRQAVAGKEAAEWLAVERAKQEPPPQGQAEKRRKSGVEIIASYQFDNERIIISRSPNGKYYNHYGYDEQRDFAMTTAGGFDTFEEAEKALYSHRPKAEKVLEPAEKAADTEKGAESLADGHGPDREEPPLAPPAPRRRAKVSPFVLHPEVPNADRHEYRITDDAIGAGTPGERFNNNVRAIRLLKKLEREDRFATPEEQAVLAQYVGWGGLADCFDERHSKYAELKALLDEDEYAAARESTLTAFYTPPVVIRSIYQALENMGFKTGNLLEPSCGIGNFIGMRPETLADSKIYGVELDGISGRIARQLYQKSSIAVQGFEKTDLPDSFFDAAIGNVPFGPFKVPDKRYDKHNFLIHDYFFARTLDKVRPGGIIAFVTSKGTMDKETPTVRKYIAQRADLLGAIRLPNNTFKDAAGTEVTSDILFLQKRDALSCEEPAWVHLNTDATGLKMNQYFIDHPEMVMGEMREVSGPYGPETACLPREGQDLGEQLTAAVQNIQGSITDYVLDDPEAEGEDKSIPADPNVRNFSYTVVDGQVYYRENSRMNPVEVSVTAANRIKGLIGIRDCVRTLIDYQTEDWPAEDIQAQQRKLNALYDAFVEKYGRINSRANSIAFTMDDSYFLLASLEVMDDERNFVCKADMFTKRTIKQKVIVTSVDTASEALAVSLAEKARVDMPFMMELTGKTEQEVYADLTGVIFLNPMHGYGSGTEEKYLPADEYLSGNVREKLEWAKRSAELYPEDYAANVQALERVQPVDLTASEISVRLGATWLPPEIVEQFMFELFSTPNYCQWNIHVRYFQRTGDWNVEGKSYDKSNIKAHNTYGTSRINGYKIIEETLNLRDVRIFDYVQDENGKKTPVLNKKETAIAQGKQELIKQAFQDWIWKDPQRRERLTRLYNDKFNSIRPREYDGSHLNFVGINPEITLRPHQVNAIAHILYGGNTLLAHVVGAGKTFEMVAAAQESKRLGLCQKSLFVVPNHLTEQWASEYLQLYPSANILVATNKDFETTNRKRFCGRIATGDYDAIIIGHSQFEKIPVSVERQRYLLEQQRREILDGIAELKASHGERFSIKQMERTRKSIDAKLEKLNDQSRKDDVVTFEELGVDRIFIDEAHYYKNLAAFSKMRNVGGISQTEAQKSSDLYMKCRYLDELTGGRGVIFATGTPISNTMVEMYTMQKYLQYGTLEKHGLLNFDAWASTFGETVTAIELAPEGTGYRAKTRFSRFYNLPELMSMFKEVADIQTADMLNLPVPKANYHNIVLKPSEQQKEMVAALGTRAERVRNKMVDSTEDNMLLITNDGRKLALDQRLLNPMLPDSDTGKVSACAENVFEIWQNTADQRSAQMVFCDLSTPKGSGDFNVYDDLRDKLIARGIPAEEIAYIHTANTEVQKKELFGKVRSGQVRVLLGSTQKMGAGTNVQHKLIALHHLDCPWRPSDLQQREGRIIRQRNENDEVDIYTYVTENTFDSYLYQLVEGKQKFIGQIMTSKSPVRSAEDIDETALSYAEIKALCTGNPHIKEKMDLDIDVQRLKLLKANHLSQRYALEDQIIKYLPQKIVSLEQRIEGYTADINRLKENTHPNEDGFSPMEVEGTVYTDKKAAGSAILAACKAMTSPDPVPLGQYRGFAMELSFESFTKEFRITLKGTLTHTTGLGTDIFGNILRLDNVLGGMEERLIACREQLENVNVQLANAKQEVEKPFPQEDELKTKSARLDELNILLNMDKRESEIVEGEPSEEAPDRDGAARER